MSDWVSSTLVFVRDVEVALPFYVGKLGFTLNMRYEEEGHAMVAGVSRGDGAALLLTSQWPDKVGHAVIYAALNADEFAALRADLDAAGVTTEAGFWGKELMIVADADGNQLWFPLP